MGIHLQCHSPSRRRGMAKKPLNNSWGIRSHLVTLVAFCFTLLVIVFLSAGQKSEATDGAPVLSVSDGTEECDLFSGRWVFDDVHYPLYRERDCTFMSDQAACEKFGRRDVRYQQWRWQPRGCNLPRFNATRLLETLRGRRMAFVGDSLNRNQWVSMVCLLDTSTLDSDGKTMETEGSLKSFRIQSYNVSVDFYWSPLLVESNSDDPVHHRIPDRIVRAHSIEKHARHWTGADILVFSSFLWWQKPKIKVLWGSFDGSKDDDGNIYREIDGMRAYELALSTLSEWLEFNVDGNKTKLFFMSLSPTHFWGDEWGAGGEQNCYNETEPILREGHRGRDSNPAAARAVEEAAAGLRRRGMAMEAVNITQMSEYRKDAHPATFRKQWEPPTEEQLRRPSSYADCIHWCLPGVPDVWNEILYAYITREPPRRR